MLQNWAGGSDVLRYLHFLGFTVVLTAAGLFCGLRIRDDKGARTFVGLAAAIVPVHFTVLGALLYSQFPWLSGYTAYPAYARIVAPDGLWALGTTAVGIAALVPIVWIAFRAFARSAAWPLAAAYLAANAMLLVPTRHPDVIGLMALVGIAGLLAFDRLALQPITALRTREGTFCRLMLPVPLLVLIGRSIHLYSLSSLVWAGLLAAVAVALFELLPQRLGEGRRSVWAQRLSTLPAAGAWFLVADTIQWNLRLDEGMVLPLVTLPIAVILVAMSLRALGSRALYRNAAAIVATGGVTLNLLVHPGIGSSFACLSSAIVTVAYGHTAERRGVFAIGIAALALGLLYHLRFAAHLYSVSPWGSLALLGVVTLTAASVLERHHKALTARARAFGERFGSWAA
jgi:hypothetical protein